MPSPILRRTIRTVVPLAAAAAVAVGTASVPASASTVDSSGTVTVGVIPSAAAALACKGVYLLPTGFSTISYTPPSNAEVVFPVSGGDGDPTSLSGTTQTSGGVLVLDTKTHRKVTFTRLAVDFIDAQLVGYVGGSTSAVPLLDLGDDSTGTTATGSTFSSATATFDPAGAAFLDKRLHTHAFADQVLGTVDVDLTTTVTP